MIKVHVFSTGQDNKITIYFISSRFLAFDTPMYEPFPLLCILKLLPGRILLFSDNIRWNLIWRRVHKHDHGNNSNTK